MGETNWRNWIILFIMAMGLTLEVMKRTDFKSGNSLENAAAAGVTEPYSVRAAVRAKRAAERTNTQSTRVGANASATTDKNRELLEKFISANSPGSATFDAAKAAEKKKKEECDEKNPKLDPVTGKPVPCKKKKEKKEEAKVEPPVTPPAPVEAKKEETYYPQAMSGGEVMPQPQAQQRDDGFTTLADWERRLLNSPDAAETKRFIDKYKQNLVTADVFYRITQMMLEDSREDMKRLGVMCAGQTPSTTSFDLLASLIKKESSGSAPRKEAEDYVTRYADLSNVRILEALLRAPNANTYTTVLATQKVGDSAKRYLNLPSASANGSSNGNANTGGTTPAASAPTTAQIAAVKRNATYFQRFLGILQDLSRNTDSGVKTQATSTLGNLQTLLAGVQQQPAQTPTAPVASTN